MKICYTGGGTGGHIFPIFPIHRTLINHFSSLDEKFEYIYIGRKSERERGWVEKERIQFFAIESGKFRRYFSLENFFDLFRILIGLYQAYGILKRTRPDIVFSKGGFVSVPVVIASKILQIPVIAHESDATPGLANQISMRCVDRMCISYNDVRKYFPHKYQAKCSVTGVPTRLNKGDCTQKRGNRDPLIVIIGGSQGALQINLLVKEIIEDLVTLAYVVHQTGVDKGDKIEIEGYESHQFIEDEYAHILNSATIVVSRSGATSIADFIEMEVPSILIPIGSNASRGDQVMNAAFLEKQGGCVVLDSENLTSKDLLDSISTLLHDTRRLEMMRKQLNQMKTQRSEIIISSIILDTVSKINGNIE